MLIVIGCCTSFFTSFAQLPGMTGLDSPWKNTQLMATSRLAEMIGKGVKVRIFNIGSVQDIKTAVHIGPAQDKLNLEKFRQKLETLSVKEPVVLYCGCCPMDKCPNIRPAFLLLKSSGFKNSFVLDIPVNLRKNWIDMGYPLAD